MTDNCPRRQLFVKFANQLDGLREQVLGAAHCIEITFGQSRFCWEWGSAMGSFSHLGSLLCSLLRMIPELLNPPLPVPRLWMLQSLG